MIEVLLLAYWRRTDGLYVHAVDEFHRLGATVRLASMSMNASYPGSGLDEVHSLSSRAEAHDPEFWRKSLVARAPQRMWLHVERDEWTLRHASRAHVLVAMDPHAIHSVWCLAQRNTDAIARSGVHAAVRDLERRMEQGVIAPTDTAEPHRAKVWAQLGRRLRPGGGAASETDQPELLHPRGAVDERIAPSVEGALALAEAGRHQEAADLQHDAAKHLEGARLKADLFGTVAARELASGAVPSALRDAYGAELQYADQLLSKGRVKPAIASFLQATRLAFHQGVHFDSLESPLSEQPEWYLEPLRSSSFYARLAVHRGRARPAAPAPVDRPARVLIASGGNTNFIGDLGRYFEEDGGAEIRILTPDDLEDGDAFLQGDLRRALGSMLDDGEKLREVAEKQLRPHLDWADVVLIEWCTRMAHFVTQVDPGTARVVMRLHSFEAWTIWPHLIDYSRVDRVVLVSDHLRDLIRRAVPELATADGPDVSVVPNIVELGRFALPKDGDVRFNVAMIGFAGVAKDPRWAMSVLRELLLIDSRYRLMLIGEDPPAGGTAIYRRYEEGYRSDLAELEEAGAVVKVGHTDDVPAALTSVGVLISSSVRESAHLAVVEGAATGAVPVVRDWPFFASGENGARTMYPQDWVVHSVAEAVERIRRVTEDDEVWQVESQRARERALADWDLKATIDGFRRALFE